MTSLADHKVYEIIKGRILDDDNTPTVDVISIGLQNLTDININPLDAYNKSFEHLQARRRLKPIVGVPAPLASESAVQPTTDITIDPTPSQSTHVENEPADTPCTETETETEANFLKKHDTNEGSDEEGDEVDEEGAEELGEFELIVVDEANDETLRRESAADVSLDMDTEDHNGSADDEYDSDGEGGCHQGLDSDDEYES
jgi:hypothetical protein